ncbi:MAG: TIGR02678 family protein [Candidatus Limivivens sp.]|nr:TIGR02678 family protein [Candidatus Limivivens sp.]
MNTLEVLLSRRWILKARERELYYQVKDELGTVKKFLMEKLGYQVIVNPYLVKVEKLPAKPENWMGIQEFSEQIEYVFFCLLLMFLEDKEAEEQFVLSELTEYLQGQYREEQIDWTVYRFRRHLIKVMKYCTANGILNVDDGSEESFARDDTSEVLYENTGVSRYFMKNFTQDIMGYTSPEDFIKEEWIDVDEDRGIVRRQRVYRTLLMTMGLYKSPENEEDFAYVRNYRNMIQGELSELFSCELQVHRTSAFLILHEECRLGRCFPEENTLSDIVLLCNGLILEKISRGEIPVPPDEMIRIPREKMFGIIESCRERYGKGFAKTYREMVTGEFCVEVFDYMKNMELIQEERDQILIRTAVGRLIGRYPEDFDTDGGKDEQ